MERAEQCFEDMAAFFDRNLNLTSDGEPEEVPAQIATPNTFFSPWCKRVSGSHFLTEDGKAGPANVVVISYTFGTTTLEEKTSSAARSF